MGDERPEWMAGGSKRPKAPRRPITPSPTTYSQPPTVEHSTDRAGRHVPAEPTTHRNVVVGVTILALLALFSFFFWFGIGMAGAINPPGADWTISDGLELVTIGDYLTGPRMAFAVVVGVLGTAATWLVVDNTVE